MIRGLPSLAARAAVFVCVLFLAVGSVYGQIGRDADPRSGRAMPFQLDRAAMSQAGVAMEGAVDENEYRVGPGDVFAITIGGPEPLVTSIPVSADGRLLLPAVGAVPVAGLTLAEARHRAIETLRPSFQRVRLDIALVQPRQFYVHVSGAVPVPGRYLATPVARVSTILELAYADTSRLPVVNPDYRPSFRDITVRRTDGTRRSVDLQRYLSTGETEHNPYLNDGDVVSVGVYDPARQSVFVDGAVPYPGSYAFREGDTAMDLIAIASGENPMLRGVEEIRITSRGTGRSETRVIRVAEGERPDGIALYPLDHVFVRGDDALRGSASVDGWVRFPGTYPVDPGVTTLDELVEMAGGLRDGALERGVHLERRNLPEPRLRPLRTNRFDSMPEIDPAAARADTVAILRSMRLADLDFMSRAYFASEMRLANRVSIDPEHLRAGGSSIRLQDGDRLVVPRDEGTVYVFGQVNRPGFIAHQSGLSATDYIAAAGGTSSISSQIFVVEAGSGRHIPLREAETIGTGDMIFVDRRQDVADTAEMQRLMFEERRARSEARFRTAQTVIQVVGTAAGVITTYLVLRNN